VRRPVAEAIERLFSIARGIDLVALVLEGFHERVAEIVVIVDNENAGFAAHVPAYFFDVDFR